MSKEILWLDNDPMWTGPYVDALKRKDYQVAVIPNVTEAESLMNHNKYDLLILDVMIPTKSEQEEIAYPPELTRKGTETGLVFYQRIREQLKKSGTKVLVLTVRLDERILDSSVELGLPVNNFS